MTSEKELFVTKQYIPVGKPISENNQTVTYRVKCVAEKGKPDGILKMYRKRNIQNLYTMLAKLDYSEYPHIYSVRYFDGNTLVVEELLDGCTLAELISQKKKSGTSLSEEEAYSIMDKLSESIARLLKNEPPIIHHDLKPENIFITRTGAVKLLNFVPDYSTAKKKPISSILHSLGAIFHEMLTGKAPVKSRCIYTGRYTPVIKKCLETNPSLRYETIDDMNTELKEAKERNVDEMSDENAVFIPFWLTIPFQGTILSFEWSLFSLFFAKGDSSTTFLFAFVFAIHTLLFTLCRFRFLRRHQVHQGTVRTLLPIFLLLCVFFILYTVILSIFS